MGISWLGVWWVRLLSASRMGRDWWGPRMGMWQVGVWWVRLLSASRMGTDSGGGTDRDVARAGSYNTALIGTVAAPAPLVTGLYQPGGFRTTPPPRPCPSLISLSTELGQDHTVRFPDDHRRHRTNLNTDVTPALRTRSAAGCMRR
jgi:hypothetical protein